MCTWVQAGARLGRLQAEAAVMLEAAVRWSSRAAEVVDIFASADANDRPIPPVSHACSTGLQSPRLRMRDRGAA